MCVEELCVFLNINNILKANPHLESKEYFWESPSLKTGHFLPKCISVRYTIEVFVDEIIRTLGFVLKFSTKQRNKQNLLK